MQYKLREESYSKLSFQAEETEKEFKSLTTRYNTYKEEHNSGSDFEQI